MSMPGAVARCLSVALGLLALLLSLNLSSLVGGMELAQRWYESAGAFPLIAAALIVLGALSHLASLWHRGDQALGGEEVDTGNARVGVAAGGLLLFVLLVPAVLLAGFAPGVAVFLLAVTRWAGLPWRRSAVFAVVTAAVLYLVFVLGFNVWFPEPWIAGWTA
ncbi:tripartite tricarboxylate transporter TctB family protein [Hydrogenophaga sp. ANAO-22]|jgi:protein-S-isoprenylcysteine O-methyltransferase Ste14|uniref:tripartite tricarboxylate transporter TctB family protein n=1 Tax=Hydrogenophaga sp. ANAO-22 TaxID=3166645 RepID=UPI0036D276A8